MARILINKDNIQTSINDNQTNNVGAKGVGGIGGFLVGGAKGVTQTTSNLGTLAQGLGQRILASPALIPGGKTFKQRLGEVKKQTGLKILDTATPENRKLQEILKPKTPAEKIGKFTEQTAEFLIPGSKISKATKGLKLLPRIGTRAVTSGAVATAQSGKIGTNTGIATGAEIAIPFAGKFITKPTFNILSRLTKGIGGGLAGVPTNIIKTIVDNPKLSQKLTQQFNKVGNDVILEKNTKTILNGISKIKNEARNAFGKGLEELKITDIKPKIFRQSIQPVLDSFGSIKKDGNRLLTNVEFDNPKNIKKASELINKLSRVKLDGRSLRKLTDDIKNAKFKTATSDERLSFNAFTKDLSNGLENAVNKSTSKLTEINKNFSNEIQLAQATEKILGKVKFKNKEEINNIARKLETLFTKKGLDTKTVNNFLTRIGIKPNEFRTSESIRQISSRESGANTKGLSFTEAIQQTTSAVITPQLVRNISIKTGLAKSIIKPALEKMGPSVRAVFIKSILSGNN